MRKQMLCLAALCVTVFVAAEVLGTNGNEPIGWGVKAVGRGGADVAVGDSPLSMNINPAAIVRQKVRCAELGLEALIPDVDFKNSLNGSTDSHVGVIMLPNAAAAFPVNRDWSFGFGAFAQAGLATNYRLNHGAFPGVKIHDTSTHQILKTSVGAAYNFSEKVSAGFALNVAQATLDLKAAASPVFLQFDQATGLGLGFTTGVLWDVDSSWTFGLSYSSPLWFTDLRADNAIVSTPGGSAHFPRGRIEDFKFPQKVALGTTYRVDQKVTLFAEGRYVNYADSSYHNMDLRAFGNGNPTFAAPFDLKFKDQWILILGTEYKINETWTAAIGYNFGNNPVPRDRAFPFAPSFVEHHATLGLRYQKGDFFLGVAYVHAFQNTLRSGANEISSDFANSTQHHNQDELELGFGFAF